jgi:hypothetical protein
MNRRGRAQPPRTSRPPTTHIATGPAEVWCWDVTFLPAQIQGRWFYLYLILDLFSRKIVGFEVHDTDSAEHAAHLAKRTALAEGVPLRRPEAVAIAPAPPAMAVSSRLLRPLYRLQRSPPAPTRSPQRLPLPCRAPIIQQALRDAVPTRYHRYLATFGFNLCQQRSLLRLAPLRQRVMISAPDTAPSSGVLQRTPNRGNTSDVARPIAIRCRPCDRRAVACGHQHHHRRYDVVCRRRYWTEGRFHERSIEDSPC